jgi:flagellar protein FliS
MLAIANLSETAEQSAPIGSLCELVVRLYDLAIARFEAAAEAAERNDIVARFQATSDAADIVAQLQLALDHSVGGQIAENLDQLYGFILSQLPMVNLDNDAALARRLGDLLQPLRQSWVELDRQYGRKGDDLADVLPAPANTVTELTAAI